jgi:hypothetical protein
LAKAQNAGGSKSKGSGDAAIRMVSKKTEKNISALQHWIEQMESENAK